ncbi:response regulator transcription factor [Gallaecimonas xiamenensis]|uniref:Fis family two component transcriptional regulator n=1 Tax=Gallaecimonas xiamenensis 3-C-1 TaxID=745411 RepID=K2K2K7_9GAMM|nr:response regulator [Gallaecimonas xiamenensis]EKE71700.1 Fis family two component transcriptional regulator [Gallaecimonas xiamenensis 3-C-1]
MKLLLLEDDLPLAQTLSRVLGRKGFEVRHLATSEQLLAEAEGFAPTVVLLDLKLEQGTSLPLIAPLRQILPQARILVITGYAAISSAVAAIKAGADDYLPKPLEMASLLAAIAGQGSAELAPSPLPPARLEWEHLHKVLADHQGNVSATARALGMHRRTLQRKLAKHPVSCDPQAPEADS